jgi:hypothetical protein
MGRRKFRPGDTVVYRKSKRTPHPGRRAQYVRATLKGDDYSYVVDKIWVIRQVQDSGDLVLETRRGKRHVIDPSDPNLRHPTLLQRIRYRERIAQLRHLDSAGSI